MPTVKMIEETAITLKVVRDREVMMTHLKPDMDFDLLCKEIREICQYSAEQQFTMKWIDDEGDACTISSEIDLNEALRLYEYNHEHQIVIHVFPSIPEKPGMLCPNEDKNVYRRGARNWRKLYKVNGHFFEPKRFSRKAICAYCTDRVWGFGRQGFKCTTCKLLVHKRCHRFIKLPCGQHVRSLTIPSSPEKFDYDLKISSASERSPLEDFKMIRVIGRGSYAKVFVVEQKETKRLYAMKVIKKQLVTEEEDIDWVQTEKHVFEVATNHPFLIGLHSCFQTPSSAPIHRLFFVIEFVNGGDLMFHMQNKRILPEDHARFYISQICLAFHFLHDKGIIYRDLKLDNVLMDSDGNIKLTDYGMCKEGLMPGDKTSTFCGTPNYISPEMLQGKEYDLSIDWWSLGVLMYEMLAGRSPFDGVGNADNPDQKSEDYLFQAILEKQIRIPRCLSVKASSALKGFLNKEPEERLGCNKETGISDIRSHPFFRVIDWDLLYAKQITPPYKPEVNSLSDLDHFDTNFTNEPVILTPDDQSILDAIDQSEFDGFEYVNPLLMSQEDCV